MKKFLVFLLCIEILLSENYYELKNLWIKKGKRNPFFKIEKKIEVQIPSILKEELLQPNFILKGIFIYKNEKYAILNDYIVKKSDFVEGYYVKDVEEDFVVLEKNGLLFTLFLEKEGDNK